MGINVTSTPDKTSSSTSDQDTFLNGTLTLTKVQENPSQVTLTCTIDEEIPEDKWLVFWRRNGSMVWLTNGTSAYNGTNDVQNDVLVETNPRQHNVTFDVSEDNDGTWSCLNLFLAVDKSQSNNITIHVTENIGNSTSRTNETQDENTTHLTTSTADTTSLATQDANTSSLTTQDEDTSPATRDTNTTSLTSQTAETSPATQDGNAAFQATNQPASSSSSSDELVYITAGAVCGVISLLAILLIVIIALRRNRKAHGQTETNDEGRQHEKREEIVMEDNDLYEGGKFDFSRCTKKEEMVMEDNDLYEGGKFDFSGGTKKEEMAMEDNDLYEGGTFDKNPGKDELVMEDNVLYQDSRYDVTDGNKEEIEMQVNDIYSSSP